MNIGSLKFDDNGEYFTAGIPHDLWQIIQNHILETKKITPCKGATSKTFVADFGIGQYPRMFVKNVIHYLQCDVFEREIIMAGKLMRFEWYPKLLYANFNEKTLVFEYVGQPVSHQNAPSDIASQLEKIMMDMASINVQHNDIKQTELLVNSSGRIFLCDFGWASVGNDLGCNAGIWNRSNRNKPGGFFCDSKALDRLRTYGIPIPSESPSQDNNLATEQHILIDWKNVLKKQELETQMPDCLEIQHVIQIPKLKNKVRTMSNFYGVHVNDSRGDHEFTMYIICDRHPKYLPRQTSKGQRRVNTNMFDLKQHLRAKSPSPGHVFIHATDNIQETKDNLMALGFFAQYYKPKKFNSLADVFSELRRHKDLEWVVMRNFEGMPEKITIDAHLDIDLLVSDYYLAKRILDGSSATKHRFDDGGHRILNYVNIRNQKVMFDLRSVGDNYYDIKMQRDMLASRIMHPKGFYIPSAPMHLNSLIYHAIVHKPKVSNTYIRVFEKYGLKDVSVKALRTALDEFMQKKGYQYVRPERSVGYFI